MLGLDVLMGFAGQVSLGQAGFMAIGGYTAAILADHLWRAAARRHRRRASRCRSLAAVLLSLVTVRLRGHFLALATWPSG